LSSRAGYCLLASEPALVLAMNAARPLDRPIRIQLAGHDEIVFGRSTVAGVRPLPGRAVRVDLADAAVSTEHARLVRGEGEWTVADLDSKNGTLVDGRRVNTARFGADNLLEIGNSFFVLRDSVELGTAPDALQTLSAPLARELALFARVATSRLPLLITGDTGTGKEVFALTAHELSRRTGPFVAVNCGAFPETLVESELFGARRGAYSGATTDRIGAAAAADRGTLFLDEVAELRTSSQAALLRFLQEGEIRPLGAATPHRVDVRVIAATHQDIGKLVAEGRFRDDLYARLRGHVLTLPPLRARREDIALLVAAILRRTAGERAARISLHRTVARTFLTHPWPHNIRELEQTLARAVTLLTDDELRVEHLPVDLGRPRPGLSPSDERTRLLDLMREHGGNVSAVARALATSRSQVQRLLERHKITSTG
jgi:transcriptional regulator with PAS, ATPase and Fis domain